MAKCLVLGATGFIGSHLVDALVAKGHTVKAFGRFGPEVPFNQSDKIELIAGDFLNRADLAEALSDIEYVFHLISTTTPITAENDPLIDIETNIHMSVEMLQEAVEKNVKKIIFASTGGAIYGLDSDHPLKESDMPKPVSPYAIGKLTIEQYLRYFRVKHGLKSVSFRISNPYGERQPLHRKQGVIPIFMEQLYNDEPLTVLGDGSMVRDYIYVKDVASMLADVFEKDTDEDVYNLGSGQGVSVNDIVSEIEKVSGKQANIQHQPVPTTFVHKVTLDTAHFTRDFHITPATSLGEGMKATWDYIVAEHERERNHG